MCDQEHLMNLLKKEVRSLLTPVKTGLTPAQLEREYKSMIGEHLPFRALGFRSVMELVRDMPDVVNICPSGDGNVTLKAVPDESTKEIASLVSRQRSNKPRRQLSKLWSNSSSGCASRYGLSKPVQKFRGLPRRGQVPPPLPAAVKSDLKELLRSSPVLLSDFNKAFLQHFGRTFECTRYGFFSMLEILSAASDIVTVVQTRAGSLLTLKNNSVLKRPKKLLECRVMAQPDKTKQTLPGTVSAPAAKTSSQIPNLPTKSLNRVSSQESEALIMQPKLEETTLVRCSERMKQLEKDMKMALAQKGPGGTVDSELKEKIKMIAAQHPEGLHVSKLPGEFKEHFKEALPVRKLGFLNIMEFVGALSDVLHIECKEGEQDWLIFDIDSERLTDDKHANGDNALFGSLVHKKASDEHDMPCWDFPVEESKSLETKFSIVTKMVAPHFDMEVPHIMQEIMKEEIPPDACQDRTLYSLPLLSSSDLIGLFVEYVVSPSQFYVRIYSVDTSEKLEDMMIEMRRCYSSKNVSDRYVIPEASICPGHLCCVRNSDGKWWYRVIIHRIVGDQEVEVFYPDFGNMEIVQKSSLRFLKYCYAKLPAQAIPCSLAWMKPAGDDWTVSATLEFKRLCELKLLVGVVDEYIDGVLYLFLCDTNSDEDIYLHDVLRAEGYTLICRENVPSKGFRKLNPSSLYLKPSIEQQASLTKADTSLIPQGSSCDLPGTTDSEPCKEVLFQDRTSLCPDPEMPYLETVHLFTEIWDENWIPSQCLEEKKNGDVGGGSCLDAAVFSSDAPSDQGSKNEAQNSEELATDSFEATSDSLTLSQTLEEFYISIAHSQPLAEQSPIDLDVNKSAACYSQPLPLTPSSHLDKCNGDVPSEKQVEDATSAQVALYTTSNRPDRRFLSYNALMFTAELQGSRTFCVPHSPAVALGASARLVTSGGCFSFSLKKVKT